LKEGDVVEYEIVRSPRGAQAVEVKKIE